MNNENDLFLDYNDDDDLYDLIQAYPITVEDWE